MSRSKLTKYGHACVVIEKDGAQQIALAEDAQRLWLRPPLRRSQTETSTL